MSSQAYSSPSRQLPSGQPLYQPSPPRSSSANATAASGSSTLSPFAHRSTAPSGSSSAYGSQMPPAQPYFSPTRLSSRGPPVSPSGRNYAGSGSGAGAGAGAGTGPGFSLRPTHARTRTGVPFPPMPQQTSGEQTYTATGIVHSSSSAQLGLPDTASPSAAQQRQSINTRLAGLTQQYAEPQYHHHGQSNASASPRAMQHGTDTVYEQDVFSGSSSYPAGNDHRYHPQTAGPHAHIQQQQQQQQPYFHGQSSSIPNPQHLAEAYYAAQQTTLPQPTSTHTTPLAAERQYIFNRASTSASASATPNDLSPSRPVSIQTDGHSLPLSAVGQPRGYMYQQDRRMQQPTSQVVGGPGSTGQLSPESKKSGQAISLSPTKSLRTHGEGHITTSPTNVKRTESRRSVFSGESNGDTGSSANGKGKGMKRSKSSDLLRRISKGKNELVSGGEYVPLASPDKNDELSRPVAEQVQPGRMTQPSGKMAMEVEADNRPDTLYIPPVDADRSHGADSHAYMRSMDFDYGNEQGNSHDPNHHHESSTALPAENDREPLLPPRLSQFASQQTLSHSDSMPLLSQLPSSFPMPPNNDRLHPGQGLISQIGAGLTYPEGEGTRQMINPSPGQYDDPASSEFAAVTEVPAHDVLEEAEEEELYDALPNQPSQHLQSQHAYASKTDAQNAHRPSQPRYSSHSQNKRISDPATGLHSRNTALFEAERGGKALHFYEEDGTWSANSLVATPLQGGSVAGRARRRSTGEALVQSQEEQDRLAASRPSVGRQLSAGAPVGYYEQEQRVRDGHYQYGMPQEEVDTRARPWSSTTDPSMPLQPQPYFQSNQPVHTAVQQQFSQDCQQGRPHTSHARSHPSSRNSNEFDPDLGAVNLEAPYQSSQAPPFQRPTSQAPYVPHNPDHPRRHVRSLSEGATLLRHGTLLHPASDPARAGQELNIMLGNRKRRPSGSKILPAPVVAGWDGGMAGVQQEKVKLEAAKKGKARVEVDVVLERECVVEGGEVRGRIEVKVGKRGVRVGMGKVRVVGYEDVSPTNRHIFYQHAHTLPVFDHPAQRDGPRTSLFASGPDSDGFHEAREGMHFIPFSMRLPLRGGAKGSFTSPNNPKGPAVRYVIVGSIKVLDQTASAGQPAKRSIAHFYRPMVVLPYLNPGVVLAPSEETVEVVERGGLGWSLGGSKGSVELRIALGRSIWVSGQRVWCEVGVKNDSSKRVKSLTLALLQTVTTFLPDDVIRKNKRLSVDKDGIPNADEALGIAGTTRRKVAEETIEADDTDWGSGQVTGKQWWTGVQPGEMGGWDLSLLIPNGMITIPRSRLVEVSYTLRLTANSSIYVDVPVVLINFLSIDPPPMPGDGARLGNRMPMTVDDGQTHNVGIASTSGHSHRNNGIYAQKAGSQHSGDSFKGIAQASSTTLHIDALLAAGRARASDSYPHSGDQDARARQYAGAHRPPSTFSDYTPEPTSSKSQLGTVTTSRSMPSGLREPHHNRSIDRRRAAEHFDPAHMGGATPARPKVPRVMSYLSVHSSELDQSLSDEEAADDDDDDEIGKTLRQAARREGRKMSLAALTRAAEREQADYMGPEARRGDDQAVEVMTDPDMTGSSVVVEEGDTTGATPKMSTLQILDQTPVPTPAQASAPMLGEALPAAGLIAPTDTRDVRAEIDSHTPTSDGLEQIDEVAEEASHMGEDDQDSFRISAYGGMQTDDELASRPGSRDLDWAPTSTRALQGYSEDLLQPIAVLPELSLDDVLRERKWSMDMQAPKQRSAVPMQAKEAEAHDVEEEDDDDKPLALIAKASPRPDRSATTPDKKTTELPDWREQERTPTQPPATPLSPPFAYDQPSPVQPSARLPYAPTATSQPHTPPKVYQNNLFTSTSSLGGTGLTSSTNRAPSRKGSALDPQALLRVPDERDPPIVHRGDTRLPSFAASTSAMSAVSDQESEIGQVVQAVKRNLSVKNRAVTSGMDTRYADEEADDEGEGQAQALSPRTPPLSPAQDRSGHHVVRGGRSPIRWSQSHTSPNLSASGGSQMHGPRAMGGANKSSSYFLEARRRSSGISPRTNYQPMVGAPGGSAEPMARTASALRNQVTLQPPATAELDSPTKEKTEEGSTLPPLAASVEGDSSSDGHALDSPQLLDTPGVGSDRSPIQSKDDQEQASHMAHQQLLADMRNLASPTPKSVLNSPMSRQRSADGSATGGPRLNPDWVPGDHLLHTEVAFARTSFSLPAGPASDDTHSHAHTMTSHHSHSHSHSSSIPSLPSSRNNGDAISPLRRPSQHRDFGARSARGHGQLHSGQRSTSPTPTAASVRSMKSAQSGHSVVLSGMQYKLQHMHARDEALRKFSVASAASSGRRESMLGDMDTTTSPTAMQGQEIHGHGQGLAAYGMPQLYGGAGQQGGPGRLVKPRKSYTTALGPRGGA